MISGGPCRREKGHRSENLTNGLSPAIKEGEDPYPSRHVSSQKGGMVYELGNALSDTKSACALTLDFLDSRTMLIKHLFLVFC
jgi:hypothetical protein